MRITQTEAEEAIFAAREQSPFEHLKRSPEEWRVILSKLNIPFDIISRNEIQIVIDKYSFKVATILLQSDSIPHFYIQASNKTGNIIELLSSLLKIEVADVAERIETIDRETAIKLANKPEALPMPSNPAIFKIKTQPKT